MELIDGRWRSKRLQNMQYREAGRVSRFAGRKFHSCSVIKSRKLGGTTEVSLTLDPYGWDWRNDAGREAVLVQQGGRRA